MTMLTPGNYTFGRSIAPGSYTLKKVSGKGRVGFSRKPLVDGYQEALINFPLCIPDWNRERTPFPDEIHIDADDGAMMIVTGDLLLEITRAEMIEP